MTYVGPNDAVIVHVGDGHYVGASRGVPVDVPAAVGKNLLVQGWQNPDPGVEKENT